MTTTAISEHPPMHCPAVRIRFARRIAAELAAIDCAEASRRAAEAAALVREQRLSLQFAGANAMAAAHAFTSRPAPITMYFDPCIPCTPPSDPIEPNRAVVDRGDWLNWLDDDPAAPRRARLISISVMTARIAALVGVGFLLGRML